MSLASAQILLLILFVQFFMLPQSIYPAGGLKDSPKIAFRIDDIQDFWMGNIQMAILRYSLKNQIPLTLGIIYGSFGKDTKLVEIIRDGVNEYLFEPALHDALDYSTMKYSEQLKRIKEGIRNIKDRLNVNPVTFIPPMGLFNNDTIKACADSGIRYFSSIYSEDSPPYETTLIHYPSNVDTANLSPNRTYYIPFSSTEIIMRIKSAILKDGFAVVMVHPQQFSIIINGTMTGKVNETALRDFFKVFEWSKKNAFIVKLCELDDSYYTTLKMEVGTLPKIDEEIQIRVEYSFNGELLNFSRKCPTRVRVAKGSNITAMADPAYYLSKNQMERYIFLLALNGNPPFKEKITTVINEATTLLLSFKTQYYLKIYSDYGTVSGEGWYDSNSIAKISVESPSYIGSRRYVFVRWEGDMNSTAPEAFVFMDGPKTIRAIWIEDNKLYFFIIACIIIVPLVVTFVLTHKHGKLTMGRKPSRGI